MIGTTLLLAGLSAALPQAAPSAGSAEAANALVAPAPAARTLDVSDRYVFGIRWHQPVVRVGEHRRIGTTFGSPGLSTRHGLIVVAQGEGEVRAYVLATGALAWRKQFGAAFEASVSVVMIRETGTELARPRQREIALVVDRAGHMRALDVLSGDTLWEAEVGADARGPTRYVEQQGEQVLLTTTVANKVHALNAVDGTPLWSQGRPGRSKLSVEGHSAATYTPRNGGMVIAGFSDGYVEAFAFASGERLWSRPLSLAGGEFIDADADPVVMGDRVYVASYSDGIYALELKTGQTVWTREAPAVSSLLGGKSALFAASSDGYIWKLGLDDGSVRFRARIPAGAVSRMTSRESMLAIAAGETGLLVLDTRDGRPLQATALGAPLAGAPTWVNKDLALLTEGGHLYALSQGDSGLVH